MAKLDAAPEEKGRTSCSVDPTTLDRCGPLAGTTDLSSETGYSRRLACGPDTVNSNSSPPTPTTTTTTCHSSKSGLSWQLICNSWWPARGRPSTRSSSSSSSSTSVHPFSCSSFSSKVSPVIVSSSTFSSSSAQLKMPSFTTSPLCVYLLLLLTLLTLPSSDGRQGKRPAFSPSCPLHQQSLVRILSFLSLFSL